MNYPPDLTLCHNSAIVLLQADTSPYILPQLDLLFIKSALGFSGVLNLMSEMVVTQIIVSSFDRAIEAYRRFKPAYVISIMDPTDGPVPKFDGLPCDRHMSFENDCSANDCGDERAQQLINIAKIWRQDAPILIHCHEGACRSTAAAFIILCALNPGQSEDKIAKSLRSAAPHADPNLLLVSEADALLGRGDRMINAILDLSPCADGDCDGLTILPIAA